MSCGYRKCKLPSGKSYANGGCRHNKAESMTRAEFGRLPIVRCTVCRCALGRVCPECKRVY